MKRQPVLPGFQRGRLHQRRLALESFGLPHIEVPHLAQSRAAEIFCPIQSRSLRRKLRSLPWIVGLMDVFVLRQRPMGLSNGMLKLDNSLRALVWVCETF